MYSKRSKYKCSHLDLYLQKRDEKRLRCAASMNDSERLTKLLESGVRPNARDRNGRTALHFASASGYSKIVEILLAFGADSNSVDKFGNTPLHLAVCTTSTATINLLLSSGCSAFQKGHNGCTPLQLAQTKLCLLERFCSPHYNEIKSKISEIISTMKSLQNDKNQEEKLSELFSSKLLLNENLDLATDVDLLLKTINSLKLEV